jgi:hypothetical protein
MQVKVWMLVLWRMVQSVMDSKRATTDRAAKRERSRLRGLFTKVKQQQLRSQLENPPENFNTRYAQEVAALANCYADDICTETHSRIPSEVGQLPEWIPGTKAALLHHGKLVTKKQDEYVATAATAPQLRKHLITKSKRQP